MAKRVNSEKVKPLTKAELEALQRAEKIRGLKEQLKEQKRLVKHYRSEAARAARELDVALAIKPGGRPVTITASKRRKSGETTPILVCSDWHVEESVEPEGVNGLNEYNLDIADQRIRRLFDKALELIEYKRRATHIRQMVLGLLGDFITGYIHEELIESNELSPTEAVLWVQKRIIAGIDMLLQNDFERIVIPCCIGNHGRSTKKPRISTAHRNNYEWLMYHQLKLHYAADKRVVFHIPQAYHTYLSLYGRTLRFHHGDWLRYNGGVGGISIPVNKSIQQWDKAARADLDIFGHWHQSKDNGNWICNGSLIGYNAFALSIKAEYEPPAQSLIFMERDYGKTAVENVYVTKE